MAISNRIFGSNISDDIQKKLELRQKLNIASSDILAPHAGQGGIFDQVGYEQNFENVGGGTDLSSRTPFVRMWTAIKPILTDEDETWEPISESDFEIENRDNVNYEYKWENEDDGKIFYKRKMLSDHLKIYQLGNYTDPSGNIKFGDSITDEHNPANEEWKDQISKTIPGESQTNKNQFLMPPPGITNITSKTIGGDKVVSGVRATTVEFIVHNHHDYDKIYSKYFLRPGAQVFVDFGWSIEDINIYDPQDIIYENSETVNNILFSDGSDGSDPGYFYKANGDLDIIFGLVTNFTSTVGGTGEYKCSVEIRSPNTQLFNISFTDNQFIQNKLLSNIDYKILGYAMDILFSDSFFGQKKEDLNQSGWEEIWASTASGVLSNTLNTFTQASYDVGVYWKSVETSDGKIVPATDGAIYISYGVLEDLILNEEFSNDIISFDSRNCWISMPKELIDRQNILRKERHRLPFLYPTGNFDETYNYLTDKRPIVSETGDLQEIASSSFTQYCKTVEKIPLRELFISLDLIKTSISSATNSNDALSLIFDKLSQTSMQVINLSIHSTAADYSTLSTVEKDSINIDDPSNLTQSSEFMKNMFQFNVLSPNTLVQSMNLTYRPGGDKLNSKIGIMSMGPLNKEQFPIDNVIDDSITHSFLEYVDVITLPEPPTRQKTFQDTSTPLMYNNKIIKQKYGSISNKRNVDSISQKHLQSRINGLKNIDAEVDDTEVEALEEREDSREFVQRIERETWFKLTDNIDGYYNFKLLLTRKKLKMMVLPLTLDLTVDGFSGYVPGDFFKIDYLPERYINRIHFIIMEITHNITPGNWTTTLKGQMLISPSESLKLTANTDLLKRVPLITKHYLSNGGLNLKGITNIFKKLCGAIPTPIEDSIAKNITSLDYIFILHQEEWGGDLSENNKSFSGVIDQIVSKEDEDNVLKKLVKKFDGTDPAVSKRDFTMPVTLELQDIPGDPDQKDSTVNQRVKYNINFIKDNRKKYKLLVFGQNWFIIDEAVNGENLQKICKALEVIFGTSKEPKESWGDIEANFKPTSFLPPAPVVGCMEPEANNYDDTANVPGECIYIGCTDENAENYDYQATTDEGCGPDAGDCCEYMGCTEEDAENYCDYCVYSNNADCYYIGCTDSSADNYNEDDNAPCVEHLDQCIGSHEEFCTYTIEGCTDSNAFNYDPEATDGWLMDDGTRISCCGPSIWYTVGQRAEGTWNASFTHIVNGITECSFDEQFPHWYEVEVYNEAKTRFGGLPQNWGDNTCDKVEEFKAALEAARGDFSAWQDWFTSGNYDTYCDYEDDAANPNYFAFLASDYFMDI